MRSPAGLILGKRAAVPFDGKRIRRVVERIVIGLLWHHYAKRLAPGTVIETIFKPNVSEIEDILINATLNCIGDTIFRYRHARCSDDLDSSIWGLQFYEHAHFVVLVLSETAQARNAVETSPSV